MSEAEFTSAAFYRFLGEHKLMGSRCKSGGEVYVPPRPICPADSSDDVEWVELSGKGKLAAFTIVYIGSSTMVAAGYDRKNPYCAGVVQLDEGPMISAQILGVDVTQPETIRIGLPLSVEFVERGEGEAKKTCLAFKPA
jgi:uncharacterized OB-fold protein